MDVLKKLWVKIAWPLARMIFPKPEFVFEEEAPENEVALYACNHVGAHGPATISLYFPKPYKMWAIHYVLNKENCTNFIFHDFLRGAGSKCRWWTRFWATIIGALLRPIFQYGPSIPVYHDLKMRTTFKKSLEVLEKGENVVLFPENPNKHSQFINELSGGFAEVGKMYFLSTNRILKIYPMYLACSLRKVLVGKPIQYDPNVSVREQMGTITRYLCDNIDRLAQTLPPHKVRAFQPENWYGLYGKYLPSLQGYWELIDSGK